MLIIIHNGDGPHPFVGDDEQGVLDADVRMDHRVFVPFVHHIVHSKQQLPSQAAPGMEDGKFFRSEMPGAEQFHGQCVPKGQGRRGAAGGSQAQGAGFPFDAHVQDDIGIFGQGGFRIPHHGDDPGPDPPDGRQDVQDFAGFPAVGQGQDHIVLGDHAQIPVDAFRRMEEEGGSAGAGQSGGDFPADDAGFAHAGHNDPAPAVEDHLQGFAEMVIDPGQ